MATEGNSFIYVLLVFFIHYIIIPVMFLQGLPEVPLKCLAESPPVLTGGGIQAAIFQVKTFSCRLNHNLAFYGAFYFKCDLEQV